MASSVDHCTFTPAEYHPFNLTNVIKPGTYDSSHPMSAFETVQCDFDCKTFDPFLHSYNLTNFNSNSDSDLTEDDTVFPIPSYHKPITTSFTTTDEISIFRTNLINCFAKESVLCKIKNNNCFECSALSLHDVIHFIVTVYRNDKDLLLIEIYHINGCRDAFRKIFNNIKNDMEVPSSHDKTIFQYVEETDFMEKHTNKYLESVSLTNISIMDNEELPDFQIQGVRSTASQLSSLANALESTPLNLKTYEYFKKCLGLGGFWVKMVLRLIELTQSQDVHTYCDITTVAMSGVAEMARVAFMSTISVGAVNNGFELDAQLLQAIQVCFKYIHITASYHVRRKALCVAAYLSRINKEFVKDYIDLDQVHKIVSALSQPFGKERDDVALVFANNIIDICI